MGMQDPKTIISGGLYLTLYWFPFFPAGSVIWPEVCYRGVPSTVVSISNLFFFLWGFPTVPRKKCSKSVAKVKIIEEFTYRYSAA